MRKVNTMLIAARNILADKSGDTYLRTGMRILTIIVIGAVVLIALAAIVDDTVLPYATTHWKGMFAQAPEAPTVDYAGT